MNRSVLLLAIAAAAFVASWFLPVMPESTGWQAFRIAFSPVWRYHGFAFSRWYETALAVASALTNVVFVVAWLALALRRVAATRLLAACLALAGVFNLYWIIILREDAGDFGFGYYLWVGAFLCLAFAVLARCAEASSSADGR
jgi:hypothetical protein